MAANELPDNAQTTADLDAGLQTTIAESTLIAESKYLVWPGLVPPEREDDIDSGTGVTYPILGAITPTSTALSADVNPSSIDLSDTVATITVGEYGNPAHLANQIGRQSKTQAVQAVVDAITQNQAESVDLIAGTRAVAGTVIRIADGAANVAALAVANIMDRNEFVAVRATLRNANAPTFSDNLYRAVLSPSSMADLFASGSLGEFTDLAKYADPSAILTGEVGTFLGFRILEASQANVETDGAGVDGGGNTLGDLIKAVFCGDRFLGAVFLDRPMVRVKPLGDSMDRFQSVYWKGTFNYGIIRNANGVVWKGRSAYATNP